MYKEDEYLLLSGIQHFMFCRRQWALIHIERQWQENFLTADGQIMHTNVHNGSFREKRGDTIIVRAMAVSSAELGISGECDAVEFKRSDSGIMIPDLNGKYTITPIEYKRGKPKTDESDIMQLAAQTMCLSEMLCCDIPFGYIYYGATRKREKVFLPEELCGRVKDTISLMHEYYKKEYTPKGKKTSACKACSVKDICLPVICSKKEASKYIKNMMERE